MRVLMLAWEYPPMLVGGLGRHVQALSRELAAAGHDVLVVTRGSESEPVDELDHEVRVRRAAADPIDIGFTTESLLAWSQAAEHGLVRAALPLLRRWRPDVVHAHDWLVAQSAVTLSQLTGAPIIATMHATEAGRHQGWLPAPLNRAIQSVERWLAHVSSTVITCSNFMREDVMRLFDVEPGRICVVPNGIDAQLWSRAAPDRRDARAHWGPEPLLVFAGRLVHEKGLQTLLAALPELRRTHPGLRLVVAGTGGHEPALRAQARSLRIARQVSWLGFLDETDLATLFAAADAVVVPSLYEPFGLVALEAAAAGAPLAVADTGGLRDLVRSGSTGVRFAPGDVAALRTAVDALLGDPPAARRMATRARRIARNDCSWLEIARRTADIYLESKPKLGIVALS